MGREIIDKANKILNKIKAIEIDIGHLQDFICGLKGDIEFSALYCDEFVDIELDKDELELLISHKKQRIQALEKELEEL